MRTIGPRGRRRHERALLVVLSFGLSVALLTPVANAAFPYDGHYPPNDLGDDIWKYDTRTACQIYGPALPNKPPSGVESANCDPIVEQNPLELKGVTGASIGPNGAWQITDGRPDVVIAVHDSGVRFKNNDELRDLANKTWLNYGELPIPGQADPPAFTKPRPAAYDRNGDGIFNLKDYCQNWESGGACEQPGLTDLNGNGIVDPEDLIFKFSDGIDQDNNGYRDDFIGWDSYEDDNDPFDEVDYGHGTGEARDSTAEADNGGDAGTCPDCMVMHMRVGDSFIADVNNFAQGEIYAVDNGASVIQSALGTLNNSRFAQEAIDYAWRRGVAFIASAADEEAGHHNQPSVLEHAITMNSLGEPEIPGTKPASYLEFRGCTNYGAYITASVPSNSCSSEAVGRSAGMVGLLYAAARNTLDRAGADPVCDLPVTPATPAYCSFEDYGALDNGDPSPGDVPEGWGLSAEEVDQLVASTADDVDFKPPTYTAKNLPPASERFPATDGWDPFFGYGRVNARRMVKAVADNKVPPEADIWSPKWFDIVDPTRDPISVEGFVASRRSPKFSYKVKWAIWNWRDANLPLSFSDSGVRLTDSGDRTTPLSGSLATITPSFVKAALDAANTPAYGGADGPAVDPATGRGDQQNRQIPDKWGVILRVEVTAKDGAGVPLTTPYYGDREDGDPNSIDSGAAKPLVGVGTKEFYLHRDPKLFTGFPLDLEGDGGASPRFADLDDDGRDEMIVATSNGEVHAYTNERGPDGSPKELPGWPVFSADYDLNYAAPGYNSGEISTPVHAAVLRTPAVGDLDRDGDLEVVFGDFQGNLSAYDKHGTLLFRKRSDPRFSTPQRPDREVPDANGQRFYDRNPQLLPAGPLPNDPDFVPDIVNRHDKLNRLIWWFMAPPTLGNIGGDKDLEILIGAADRHLYAFDRTGTTVPGFPVLLRDPAKTAAVDPDTHEVTNNPRAGDLYGTKIVTAPALGDVDGDKKLEIFVAVNEEYPARTTDSPDTDVFEEPLNTDDPAFKGLCNDPPDAPVRADPKDPTGGTTKEESAIDCAHQRVYAVYPNGSLHGGGPGNPANGHPNANAFLPGWPVRLADAQAELLPVVGSGPDGSPIIGNVNGGTNLEIGIFATAGPGYILNIAGRSIYGRDPDGRDRTLLINGLGPNTNSNDAPSIPGVGGAIFSDLGPGRLSFAAPAAGLGKLLDVVLPEDQLLSDNHLGIWELTEATEDQPAHRSQLPSFPREVNDLQFLTTPSSFDINGDGLQEVLEASAYSDLHAFGITGIEVGSKEMSADGWPKFTGGWSVSPAAAGDFDDNGTRDIAMTIREGRFFLWNSNGAKVCDPAIWPDFAHDPWNSNDVETDAQRPRVITDLRATPTSDGRQMTLEWTAPGDDGRCGKAHSYEARRAGTPLETDTFISGTPIEGEPTVGSGGALQQMTVTRQCSGDTYVAIRTWDANPERNDTGSANYNAAHPANPSAVNPLGSNVLIPQRPASLCGAASTTAPPSSPPPTSPGGTPISASPRTGSPTPSKSTAPSQSGTPSGSPTEPGRATTSLETSRSKTRLRAAVNLSGRVTGSPPCAAPYDITIERRLHGTDQFRTLKATQTDAQGIWQTTIHPTRNATYRAGVESRSDCAGELSSPADVLVRVKVAARTGRTCRAGISGRVRPPYPGRFVELQWRKDHRWHDVERDKLSRRSRFKLHPERCNGPVYRVVWRKQSERNIWGKSRPLHP